MPFTSFQPLPRHRSPCRHPEHHPPSMIVLPEGTHTYQCPACGQSTQVTIILPTMGGKPEAWVNNESRGRHTLAPNYRSSEAASYENLNNRDYIGPYGNGCTPYN